MVHLEDQIAVQDNWSQRHKDTQFSGDGEEEREIELRKTLLEVELSGNGKGRNQPVR